MDSSSGGASLLRVLDAVQIDPEYARAASAALTSLATAALSVPVEGAEVSQLRGDQGDESSESAAKELSTELPETTLPEPCVAELRELGIRPATEMIEPLSEDAAALASVRTEEVEPYIQSLGFYRAKARSIVTLSQQLVERHNGQVPSTLDELVELAGVGRKTANVVLGNAFDVPGLTVDTHFGRLARRMGFTTADAPKTVEKDVAELIERKDWTFFSHRMVYHGRRICHAKKPACGVCPVADLCPSYGAGETNEQAARKLMKYEMAPGREDLHLRFLQGATRRELMAEGYPLSA